MEVPEAPAKNLATLLRDGGWLRRADEGVVERTWRIECPFCGASFEITAAASMRELVSAAGGLGAVLLWRRRQAQRGLFREFLMHMGECSG